MGDQAEAVEILRQALARYTQKELAQLLDKSTKTISRWDKGTTPAPSILIPALKQILSQGRKPDGGYDFTFVDLFAGIGGIRLGFEAHGGKCVFTSEWNSFCQQTYRAYFNDDHEIFGDITKISNPQTQLPDFDVLVAGFPCQPFSIAGVSKKNALGMPHGFACEAQGTLFLDLALIIAAKRPSAFLLENVKSLVSHDKGKTFRVIKDVLENQLGYMMHYRVVDGQHFVPQHRERILIVGFREQMGFDWNALRLPDKENQQLRTILHPQDGTEETEEPYTVGAKAKVNPKYTLTDHLWNYLQNYAAKHRAAGNGFGYGLVGKNDVARTLSARYYKDGSEILVVQGKTKNPRRLTPRECARLMGYPDTFKIPVSDTQAYKQFGNSVVVHVMREVARVMKPFIMQRVETEATKNPKQLAIF